jgi:di/tricarboxylate transporter
MLGIAYAAGEDASVSGGIASFIPLIIIFLICYFLYKKLKKHSNLPENPNPGSSNVGTGWRLDRVLIAIGSVALLSSLFMDTSVETALGNRVNNIGLMKDQQNYVLVSVVLLVIGVILNVSNRSKNRSTSIPPKNNDELDTKICPYCAETIKQKATICRYCNKNQTS